MCKNLLFSLLLLTSFSACSQPATKTLPQQTSQMPTWIFTPYKDGILGSVGSAKVHFKGSAHQRKLAISRALDELARQHGVQVHTETSLLQTDTNGRTDSRSGIYSFQTSDGIVSAHIEAVWQDPTTKELFVWMRDN